MAALVPEDPMAFSIKSSAFANGGKIPRMFTCDGLNTSPALEWSEAPAGTQSLLVVCNDPDAPGGTFRHWAAYNIPADYHSLEEGIATSKHLRFAQAVNDFGHAGYDGPCPPRGHKPHAYHFRVSALKGRIDGVSPKTTCAEIMARAKPLEIASAEVVGYYGR